MKITTWGRWGRIHDSFGHFYGWLHNHIESGWVTGNNPTPKSHIQKKSWPKHTWRKQHTYLINGKVVEDG